jgi:hypothetical protein
MITNKKKSKHNKTRKTNKSRKQQSIFALANNIFNSLSVNKIEMQNNKDFYWIISKKYNDILDNHKFQVVHFLLYCLMRFNDWEYKSIIEKYISFPINFPINIKFNTTYTKYNSFNSLLYLNNFIYQLIETNQTIETFIKESSTERWGYNASIVKINDKSYYNIYYVIKTTNIIITKILFSNTYPILPLLNYIDNVKDFVKNNKQILNDNNLLTSVYKFNLEHKLNYKNKFITINGLYIPNGYLELNTPINIDVIKYLVYKEINFPTTERVFNFANTFLKCRNVEQLLENLYTTKVSINDFNDMIRSIKPLSFKTQEIYRAFINDIAKIVKTKFQNFTIKVLGSSTTFYSASPSFTKVNKIYSPTDSDIDVTIIPNEDFDFYKSNLNTISTLKYDANINIGVYVNPVVRDFFGEELMQPFFNKWGPQELTPWDDNLYIQKAKNKTILKRHISITMSTKKDMFQYYDVIKNNKTCLANFSTFIRDGKTISFWNENDEYITNLL